MDREKGYLFFPQGIKSNLDIINGIGTKEMVKVLLLSLGFNSINLVLYVINQNVVFSATYFIITVAGSFMIFMKDTSNTSFADQIRFLIRFQKSQKKYTYHYLDEWQEKDQ